MSYLLPPPTTSQIMESQRQGLLALKAQVPKSLSKSFSSETSDKEGSDDKSIVKEKQKVR